MPESDGKLTQDEGARAIQWLNSKQPQIRCSVCGTAGWSIAEHYVHAPVFRGGQLVIGGVAYPQIMLTCTNCAHSILFSAVLIGIYPKEERAKEKEQEQVAAPPKAEEPKPPSQENTGGR